MNINAKVLKSLGACEEGYRDFVRYHPDYEGPLSEALLLDNLLYEHKLWVALSMVPQNILEEWLEDCIEYIAFSYPESYLNGPKVKGVVTKILNLLHSGNEDDRLNGIVIADAFKDIICVDYPEQKDINLQLLIQLI